MLLDTSSIMNVPLRIYDDFVFIVNGKEFKTTKLISDLLSPNICKIHSIDPILSEFNIHTQQKGDFSYVLNLLDFDQQSIPETEIEFISEVLEILGNNKISVTNSQEQVEVTIENVFSLIKKHEQFPIFYKIPLQNEIEFAASHFYELEEKQLQEIDNLTMETIERIVSSSKIQLLKEDQLLDFINERYSKNSNYAKFYEYVCFNFISRSKIAAFIDIFNIYDFSIPVWKSISERLKHDIRISDDECRNQFKRLNKVFKYKSSNPFDGIINHIRKRSNDSIEGKINITSSDEYGSSYSPKNAVLYNNRNRYFQTNDRSNSYICFDFKDHRVILNSYEIRSASTSYNPKYWYIQGSNDNSNWERLDEQRDCPYLNGSNLVHSFPIKSNGNKGYRYIRLYQFSNNWCSNNYLCIDSIEFYGTLV